GPDPAIAYVAFTLGVDWYVHCHHKSLEAGCVSSSHLAPRDRRIPGSVDLEPGVLRSGCSDRFDRRGGRAGNYERNIGIASRLGQYEVGSMTNNCSHSGWCDTERRRVPSAKNLRHLVWARHVQEIARKQQSSAEGCRVARHAFLVLDPAIDIVEDDPRQTPASKRPQIRNAECLIDTHGSGLVVRWGSPDPDATSHERSCLVRAVAQHPRARSRQESCN